MKTPLALIGQRGGWIVWILQAVNVIVMDENILNPTTLTPNLPLVGLLGIGALC